ncbi:MAG: acetyl-CoA carboxylase subunit beta [Candidatus Melainabacteria bacterium RIFOXYA12_FULL_32_12]|nr:MAG: acetyl-CoA carboxylase subunit beta [Candidatus Melainabacteria bacterium RIFOXYA2_FULL_32_9]OGI28176.1 MAG: acetyl-CoA carboxylase subunit beta [Candidatus Melainabacteria bacterium RIFOXYA12_FULL_32_12]
MSLRDWFANRKKKQFNTALIESKISGDDLCKLWVKCFNCNANFPRKDLEKNLAVCPKCDYHFRIGAYERIEQLLDEGSFQEINSGMFPSDPLDFVDTAPYKERQKGAKEKTGLNEAVVTGIGSIDGWEVAVAIMDFAYMGGSMGSVVGEKVTRLIELGIERKVPIIAMTSSGGARMQESSLSLMQMAKTSCAVARANEEGILYITVLTEPTFGGVTASFGTLGDIIIAEQGARIGFAGRRVIEQTIRQKLPADFQTAEYLLKYGQVDLVSHRKDLKDTLEKIIRVHTKNTSKMKQTKAKESVG